jgi:preprotein translocase subunit SecE
VALRKRRQGKDAVDEELAEVLDDAADDDVEDIDDEAEDDEAEDEPVVSRRRAGTAIKVKKADTETVTKVKSDDRVGPLGRLLRFFREIVAELRKVIWPTRKELLTYATVVVVFVTVVVTIVALMDTGFAWAVLHVFGGQTKK